MNKHTYSSFISVCSASSIRSGFLKQKKGALITFHKHKKKKTFQYSFFPKFQFLIGWDLTVGQVFQKKRRKGMLLMFHKVKKKGTNKLTIIRSFTTVSKR